MPVIPCNSFPSPCPQTLKALQSSSPGQGTTAAKFRPCIDIHQVPQGVDLGAVPDKGHDCKAVQSQWYAAGQGQADRGLDPEGLGPQRVLLCSCLLWLALLIATHDFD